MQRFRKLAFSMALGVVPAVLYAFSTGPQIMRTGAPVDGGMNCTVCHQTFAPANSDPAGRVVIDARNYVPSVKQIIRVTVFHPQAVRWGFQLTARLAKDETRAAGTFTASAEAGIQVRCPPFPGALGPCNGQIEFAEHTAAATLRGTNGSSTFEVEWTPPSTDEGEVVFYAAGNAANNNSNPQGDRIYTTSLQIRADAPCELRETPTIRRVENAAHENLVTISTNGFATIRGSGFAPAGQSAAEVGAIDLVDGTYPKAFKCVAVEVNNVRVPLFYVRNDQINVQAPTISAPGPVLVRVILNPGTAAELRSNAFNATFADYGPAFFHFYQGGTPVSISARDAATNQLIADPAIVQGARFARPGDVVILDGTGFGVTDPVFQAGEIAPLNVSVPFRDSVTVTVGGTTLAAQDVMFAGLLRGASTALAQLTIRLPMSVSDGNIPVSISVGGVATPQLGGSIPVRR